MPLSIRPAYPTDAEPIAALLAAYGLPHSDFQVHLDTFLVAVGLEGAVVGCAGLEVYPDAALLRSVAVADSHRGQGLGQRLTEAALAMASDRGVPAVYLLTETAAGFFPRHGFRPIDRALVPASIRQTTEFSTLCPSSALVLHRALALSPVHG